jgi:hypothetical protein
MIRAAVAGVMAGSPRATPSKLGRFEVLEQIALGAGLDGAEEIGLFLADREHDDGDLGVALLDLRGGLQATHVRHADVHQNHFRRRLIHQLDRRAAIGSLAHYFVAPGQQQRRHAIAE